MSTTLLRRIASQTTTVQNRDGQAAAGTSLGRNDRAGEPTPASQQPEKRLSDECFRSVWMHSIDGMRLTDRAGRIVDVNPAYCRLVGLPREQLVGELFTITHEETARQEALESYQQRFESGTLA